jgi:mannose-1-phosphate guanylyltransferase
MQIDNCLILAAGFGTRMGVIGQHLPKVLWPVFEKSLLELQVGYAKGLGIKNIFINLHYMGEQIEAYCKDKSVFEDVTFLWEKPEILDIGGAVHNLAAKVNYKGKLLVLNADQFFYQKKEELMGALTAYEKYPVVLFNYHVNSADGYNALEVDGKRVVKSLIKNKDLKPDTQIETYTGNALVDLSKLEKIPGVSKFFDSVANFQKKEIAAVLVSGEYWDFGTVKRFWETSFQLLETYRQNSNHPFLRFLVEQRALKTWKINLNTFSYHAKTPRVINLTPDEINVAGPMIVMGNAKPGKAANKVWWNEYHEEVKL